LHLYRLPLNLNAAALGLLLIGGSFAYGASRIDDLVPQTPAAFLPGGVLGIQLGGSWQRSKQNPSLHQLNCQAVKDASDFDEVCFFRASTASRVRHGHQHQERRRSGGRIGGARFPIADQLGIPAHGR
jgi:hypothetical protein